jgi:formylglycine-generating enzyme required for sulfatase activity
MYALLMKRVFCASVLSLLVLGVNLPDVAFAQQDDEEQEDTQRVRRLRDSLAVDPTQEWVPGSNTDDRSREINRKLSLADRAMAAGELIEPANANAFEYYNAVLEIDSGNVRAREGIEALVSLLLEQVETALQSGQRSEAQQLIGSIRRIQPDHPRLAEIQDRVNRRAELEQLLQTAEQQIANHQLTAVDGDNALASLNAAAAIDPSNARVQSGLEQVQSLLIADAESAAQANEFEQAFELLEQAGAIQGQSDRIAASWNTVVALQEGGWEQQTGAISALIGSNQLDQADAELALLESSGFTGSSLQQLRARLSEARVLADHPPRSRLTDAFVSGQGSGPEMVVIGAGRFTMGSPNSENGRKDNEGPQQQIQFERPFALGRTEVSVGQFRQFVEATGYQTDIEQQDIESTFYDVADGSLKKISNINWKRDYENKLARDHYPVIHVSWNDAMAYISWLSEATGRDYRLASESEFEYSLRAGSQGRYWWGDRSPKEKVENLTGERDGNDGPWEWPTSFRRYGDDHWGPAPVGTFMSNDNDIQDAGGNVMEWLADCYVATLDGIPRDGSPRIESDCERRVVKGASWASTPDQARSAYRSAAGSSRSASIIGFRVARNLF